jgi:hypothetical protein
MTKIPATPDAITPEWLTTTLRESGAIRGATVQSVSVQPVPAGSGFVGQAAHLRLTYDRPEEGAPAAMFAKLSSAVPQVREQLRTVGLYETEAGFYHDLGPDIPVRVPRAYAAIYAEDSAESLLLLEEIGHLRFGDNVAGCSPEDATLVIRTLAELHAHFWNSPRLRSLAWLRSAEHDVASAVPLYRGMLPAFEQRCADLVPAGAIRAARSLQDWIHGWMGAYAQGPQTLVHGDFRPDNLAFDGSQIVIFDWQVSRRFRGTRDLAYFMTFGLSAADRRVHERALLELYHHTLLAGGVTDYSLEDVLADYRRSLGSPLVTMVIAGGMLDFSSDRGTQLVRNLGERVAAAVEDHDFPGWGAATYGPA